MATCSTCGKRARYTCYGKPYCGRHKFEDNILVEYNIPLANIEIVDEDPIADINIKTLNGYINIKVGWPVFVRGETCSLALMSRICYDTEHFSRFTLAQELRKAIEYFISRPDVYNLSGIQLEQMKLDRIIYDSTYGIFIANISII